MIGIKNKKENLENQRLLEEECITKRKKVKQTKKRLPEEERITGR